MWLTRCHEEEEEGTSRKPWPVVLRVAAWSPAAAMVERGSSVERRRQWAPGAGEARAAASGVGGGAALATHARQVKRQQRR
ncbi:hypothetical protein E2562_008828 [Oryza meyeriana var. granulata]|uniref:DUF834 domain-containing protein n=1 Tax=Oryza meyeriana var. granulata TaxID=110450 RepID=A0A6G1D0S8_9ORYZ|nr:hypothetical protein E2562_008828 [Oryza meyeriana var. granulata]